MKSNSATSCLEFLLTKMFPITISLFALILSTISLYINYLKSPDISFVVAPYVSHVVDNNTGNEAFFIPLTVLNRGARPGTALSFELTVTHISSLKQAGYSAQYYAKPEDQRLIGSFFSPMSLQGYSTASQTVSFYPTGLRIGKLFADAGVYEFQVRAITANVRNESPKSIVQAFRVTVTDEMVAAMQSTPDGEYPYPMRIESGQ